jgi:hypothetical protein
LPRNARRQNGRREDRQDGVLYHLHSTPIAQ